jgi:NTE family protein
MARALVLSGGSIKGCFQAGAIAEVFERGFVPDAVYGTSVGSLNGAFLTERAGRAKAAGVEPDWPAIGQQLEAFWRNEITSFNKIARKRSILKLIFDIAFSKFDGFVDTRPLRELVEHVFLIENLRQSPITFSACAVNIANGKLVYGRRTDAHLIDYIIASTAIPLSMPISIIGNEPFLDGGLREVAPLRAAIEDKADEIICIVCQSKDVGGASFNRKKILELVDRLMDIVTNELVSNDIDQFLFINKHTPEDGSPQAHGPFGEKRHIPIKVIRPDKPLALSLEDFTPKDIDNALRAGRAAATRGLEEEH